MKAPELEQSILVQIVEAAKLFWQLAALAEIAGRFRESSDKTIDVVSSHECRKDIENFDDYLDASHKIEMDLEEARHEKALERAKEILKSLREKCERIGAKNTTISIDRALAQGLRESHLGEIMRRAFDELGVAQFLLLEPKEVRLLKSSDFPQEVFGAFPKAAEDIEEAGKCLSLGRYTASVFHLMRAMECAVQALSAKLGIGNVDREWGKLLSDMHLAIEPMPKGPDRDKWSESHSHLYHVKQAWRNDVMHPKETYTEEQANEVYQAARVFMRHLADLI